MGTDAFGVADHTVLSDLLRLSTMYLFPAVIAAVQAIARSDPLLSWP